MILRKDKNTMLTDTEMDDNFSELSQRVTMLGNQTIAGTKSFSQNPILTPNPVNNNNLVTLSNFELLGNKESITFSEEQPLLNSNVIGKDYWFNIKTNEIYKWLGTEWDIFNNPIKISGKYILSKDHKLYVWDSYIQLLIDTNIIDVIDVFSDDDTTFIEKSDGTVWSTGYNGYGQLGLGDNIDRNVFTQIPGLLNPNKISIGSDHTFIEKSDGTVWACGSNYFGQLGLGDNIDRNVFTLVPGITYPNKISTGSDHTFIEKSDGTVWSTGYNGYGQLGFRDTTNRNSFTQVPGLLNPTKIECYGYSTIIEQNIIFPFGYNGDGQLGIGYIDWNNAHYLFDNELDPSFNNCIKIISNSWRVSIIKSDGTFWVAGNFSGPNYSDFTQLTSVISAKNATYYNDQIHLYEDTSGFVYGYNTNKNTTTGFYQIK